MRARPPAVAGRFYPGEPDELRANIRELLSVVAARGPAPKALVAPHAGYVYSGAIAASAYGRLRDARGIERVVLMGPAHRVFVRGLATSTAEAFTTPLGDIEIDRATTARLEEISYVAPNDRAHAPEHSLEVHLPFLQVVLGDFTLVPVVVGEASVGEVEAALDVVWGGPETLIVISTDLSHHYDYETARRLDAATARAIRELKPDDIGEEQACGRIPLRGLLAYAMHHGMRCEELDLRNSGDTAGPRAEVVGYGSFALS
jgi:AmmeMemoRadiSam system protein B